MKKILFFLIIFFSFITLSHASANPYGKYQDLYGVKTVRCTWYAWQEAYNNAGVALPGWGNAQTWYNLAAQAGFSVGQVAKANSLQFGRVVMLTVMLLMLYQLIVMVCI